MTQIISIINNKGGAGKTTTCLNLGVALAQQGHRVLLVDLDSQCNLTSALGIHNPKTHIGHILLEDVSIHDVIVQKENLSVIPSTDYLLDYEYRMNTEMEREFLLKYALDAVKSEYDYILIDNAPSLGTLAINSLVASDSFIVPMPTENFAFIGLDKIVRISSRVKKRMNPDINLSGILLTRYNANTKFSKAILKSFSENELYKDKVFNTKIRRDIQLMSSAAFGQSIFTFAPKSHGAKDYSELASEFIQSN